jgi:hypothetical protein
MPRLSFTLRDVFWLTLVVGTGVGWWVRERQAKAQLRHAGLVVEALGRGDKPKGMELGILSRSGIFDPTQPGT